MAEKKERTPIPVGSRINPVYHTGRTPKSQQLKNYDKALNLLDEHIEEALQVLINGLSDPDKYFRFNCACSLIKKVIPDKKSKEGGSSEGSKSLTLEFVDKRTTVLSIVDALENIDLDEIRQMGDDELTKLGLSRENPIINAQLIKDEKD